MNESTFSKWLSIQVLLDSEEMRNLITELGDFHIYYTGAVCQPGEGELTKEQFLTAYTIYAEALKQGILAEESLYRNAFSSVFTLSSDHIYRFPVGNEKHLMRVSRPVVQLQQHRLGYSLADEKFRPMVFGIDSLSWGIQFSYPQLYQDGQTKEAFKVTDAPQFPNTQLFRKIQLWMRQSTVPTPFVVNGKRINVPMRIGKKCLLWVNKHPQLVSKQMSVMSYEN